jgi:hypothetical protein
MMVWLAADDADLGFPRLIARRRVWLAADADLGLLRLTAR